MFPPVLSARFSRLRVGGQIERARLPPSPNFSASLGVGNREVQDTLRITAQASRTMSLHKHWQCLKFYMASCDLIWLRLALPLKTLEETLEEVTVA